MGDLVERLRDQGKDAFAKHYSLGMFKLCAEAADEIERLREACSSVWLMLADTGDNELRLIADECRAALDPISPAIQPPIENKGSSQS